MWQNATIGLGGEKRKCEIYTSIYLKEKDKQEKKKKSLWKACKRIYSPEIKKRNEEKEQRREFG